MSSPTRDSASAGARAVPRGAPAILHVDAAGVELGWSDKNGRRYAARAVESHGVTGLVAAAKRLVAESAPSCRRVTLSLAASMFDSRQMLLGRLPDGKAQDVLARKAANAIGVEVDACLFWAQRCHPPLEETDSAQETWLVHAHLRAEYMELLVRLRRVGIHVVRTVAAREVLAHSLDDIDGNGGRILVTSTGRAVYAHLFRGRNLVQESCLPLADFSMRSSAYERVIQDVRNLAAFWSKGSRGAPLQGVYLAGFTATECEGLTVTLAIASQGAEVHVLSQPDRGDYESLRSRLLHDLRANAARGHSLFVPLPTRIRHIAAAALVLSGVAAFASSFLVEHWTDRIDTRERDIATLLDGTEDVEGGEDERVNYLATRASLATSIASLRSLEHKGIPLDDALEHVFARFSSVADIGLVSIERIDEGTRVIVEATLPHDAASAARHLEALRVVTEQDPRFADVSFEPSSRVPDIARDEVLSFTFIGLFTGAGA